MDTFTTPAQSVSLSGVVFNFSPVTAVIHRIEKYAGATIGTAVVSYPAQFAKDAVPELGSEVKLGLDGVTVFRGVIGAGPYTISREEDTVQLILFDDKWLLSSKIIGQVGIGTQGDPVGSEGFKDVGFDVVFNEDGRPNKEDESDPREFCTGSNAAFWTLRDIMHFIFTYYVDSDVASLSDDNLSDSYDFIPTHLSLVGMNVLQAIDQIVTLSGESWGLKPGDSSSSFVAVRPGHGSEARVDLVDPQSGANADSVDIYHADQARIDVNVKDCRDVYQAVSGNIIKETTISNQGASPVLVSMGSFKDKEYKYRLAVDVGAYSDNGLGCDLSSGSKPKRILPHLVTRKTENGDAYVTAAEIAAANGKEDFERVGKWPVWISLDMSEGSARLVASGYRFDSEYGFLDFKSTIDLYKDELDDDDKPQKEEIKLSDYAGVGGVGVWMTVAMIMREVQSIESDSDSNYLPKSFYQVIQKPDLVPQRREDARLPDLSQDNPNETTVLASGDEEIYVDIESSLQDVVTGALATSPAIEKPITLKLPFIPQYNIGDKLSIEGRDIGASGDEVIVMVKYDVYESFETHVEATNITAGIDPQNFVEK